MEAVPQVPLQVAARAGAYRGRILLFQGRAGSASRRLTDAALSVRANQGVYPSWCLALAAESHALLGHHEEAREAATEAVILDRSEIQAYRPDQLRALAWVDAQSGRISSATDQLWAAADLAASRGQRSFEIIILDDLLRLGEHEAAGRTRELAVHVDGAWSAAIASHADAVLSGATVDLETAAEAFRGIGARLVAAELWATASAARQREGLTARATEAARHAKELSERCEGARTQPLEWAVADVPLDAPGTRDSHARGERGDQRRDRRRTHGLGADGRKSPLCSFRQAWNHQPEPTHWRPSRRMTTGVRADLRMSSHHSMPSPTPRFKNPRWERWRPVCGPTPLAS